MTVISEVQKLKTNAIVSLYELDCSLIGGQILYFHNERIQNGGSIMWKGVEYIPFPIQTDGFESSQGKELPRPVVTVANVSGLISSFIIAWDDLIGCKFTRRRTFEQYLDNGATPDPEQAFPDEVWEISRKSSEDNYQVSFELCAAFDLENIVLPKRPCTANACPWLYRGTECGYDGPPVADYNDSPTTDPLRDVCGKRDTSCRLRFGTYSELPFGAFVGVGIVR